MKVDHRRLFLMFPAVAVIQSLPIFDETRLFSLPLPAVMGQSLSFSCVLQLYLVLMFLGKRSTDTAKDHNSSFTCLLQISIQCFHFILMLCS